MAYPDPPKGAVAHLLYFDDLYPSENPHPGKNPRS
jgi:hypothetical protein